MWCLVGESSCLVWFIVGEVLSWCIVGEGSCLVGEGSCVAYCLASLCVLCSLAQSCICCTLHQTQRLSRRLLQTLLPHAHLLSEFSCILLYSLVFSCILFVVAPPHNR